MPENFSSTLFQWYAIHKRELPWREESNPYRIWISEIILQQTRVAQGWNYYERFIRNERDYQAIYDYIIANPMNWQKDEEFPLSWG